MTNRIDYAKASPDGYRAFGGVHVAVQKGSLPGDLINLVYLRVSQINGCAFCIDMHSRDLLKSGIAIDKLVLVPVWHESGKVFSQRERAALAWAETVTRIAETSRAFTSGLRSGDVIIAVNQRDIDNAADFERVIATKPRQLVFTVVRGEQAFFLRVQ